MSQGPLRSLRVVDFTTMISGGFAASTLADFGADVITVEHPTKTDPIREWKPIKDGESMWWKSLGRNQRCVTLNLSSDEGQAMALELVEDADIVLENFRSGTMERWNLGYEELKAVNEGIVMVRITGYGQTGPKSDKPGFGSVAEGISGWAHSNGFPDSDPLLPPIPLADLTAGQYAAQSAVYAVFDREMTEGNEGQVVDVSLYEPLFRLFIGKVEAYDTMDYVSERTGNRSENSAPRNMYETADGYIALSASSQRIFENVMAAIGREDLIDDPRFETNADRLDNVEELDAIIEDWTSERPTDEVIEVMEASDAIVGPIYDMADIFEDAHYQARDNIVSVEDPDLGEVKTHGIVPKYSETPGEVSHLGPSPGEHNEEVYLEEVGIDEEEYERLSEGGVI
ncbi:CaiB/BaiF CoA transferase family protein [Natrialba asiatica]|uniref:CAIB/BAIF family protein n=1 Tax=Natrialba asiatica (strain ATCC 700177 / DSM 12278 / JCM 9576 / FERM P-10747 / NBRC 102637 / 172P1) TaxID=29540 RepID=M0AF66_NATA1|nr:CoA transferase [Natrialba asiatica]ELY97189.1 CAIB/BAIF family protein [Natrialba asiatica DSM 12278]